MFWPNEPAPYRPPCYVLTHRQPNFANRTHSLARTQFPSNKARSTNIPEFYFNLFHVIYRANKFELFEPSSRFNSSAKLAVCVYASISTPLRPLKRFQCYVMFFRPIFRIYLRATFISAWNFLLFFRQFLSHIALRSILLEIYVMGQSISRMNYFCLFACESMRPAFGYWSVVGQTLEHHIICAYDTHDKYKIIKYYTIECIYGHYFKQK